jgi:hypothetical protein
LSAPVYQHPNEFEKMWKELFVDYPVIWGEGTGYEPLEGGGRTGILHILGSSIFGRSEQSNP